MSCSSCQQKWRNLTVGLEQIWAGWVHEAGRAFRSGHRLSNVIKRSIWKMLLYVAVELFKQNMMILELFTWRNKTRQMEAPGGPFPPTGPSAVPLGMDNHHSPIDEAKSRTPDSWDLILHICLVARTTKDWTTGPSKSVRTRREVSLDPRLSSAAHSFRSLLLSFCAVNSKWWPISKVLNITF